MRTIHPTPSDCARLADNTAIPPLTEMRAGEPTNANEGLFHTEPWRSDVIPHGAPPPMKGNQFNKYPKGKTPGTQQSRFNQQLGGEAV